MVTEGKEWTEKRELAPLKEKISQFLYNNFIDFERDKGVIINGETIHPSFILNNDGVVIDCFRLAAPGNPDFDRHTKLYAEDNVKFVAMDLSNFLNKNVEATLKAKLIGFGVDVK